MRVAVLTNLTTSASLPVVRALADSVEVELVQVYLYNNVRRASLRKSLQQFGVVGFTRKFFKHLMTKSRQVGMILAGGKNQAARTVHEFVQHDAVPHSVVSNMNDEDSISHLQALQVDFLVVCVCMNLLRRPVINTALAACINIHPSLLPKYRGPLPVFWLKFHGQTQTGVTFHGITPGIDDGPIYAQVRLMVDPADSVEAIEAELMQLAADNVVSVLQQAQIQSPEPQDESQSTYYSFPTPQQRRQLARGIVVRC